FELAGSVTSSSSATSVSRRSLRRAPPATRTPASARARAVARPMPEDAPVTIAVLPLMSYEGTGAMLTTWTLKLDRLLSLRDVVDLERHVVKIETLLEQTLEA